MTIASYQGAVGMLRAAQSCLEAELPAVLATAETGLAMTLPDPRQYWRGEIMPEGVNTPGVGLWVRASRIMEAKGSNLYNVDHETIARIVVRGGGPEAATLTAFYDSLNAYAQAVTFTLGRYLTGASYGAPVGVFKAESIDVAPLPFEEDDRGQFWQAIDVQMSIMQRTARWS